MTRRVRNLLLFAMLLGAENASATTFVPMTAPELLRAAHLVVLGRVHRIESVLLAGGRIETRITLAVERTVKGRFRGDSVVVTEPGGEVGGRALHVFGAPSFARDEEVLVFLRRTRAGTLATIGLALGKYAIESGPGGRPLARSGAPGAPARPLARLLAVLDALARTAPEETVEPSPPEPATAGAVQARFSLEGGGVRWFEPDRGAAVRLALANGDTALGAATSRTSFDAALLAWTSVPTASITLEDAGSTPVAPSIAGGVCDGHNTVQLDDPFAEIGDLVNCHGVLAVGGYCSDAETRAVGGTTFRRIVEGDVTVNNGFGACFDATDLAETLTHEIGHVIGLGHSSENPSEPNPVLADATMYYRAHFDGRGAAVRADDVAGVSRIYPADGDGDGVPDVEDHCPGTAPGLPVDATGCACADPGHVPCDDHDACTTDECNPSTAACRNDPVGCVSLDPCMLGRCDPANGCVYGPRTGFDAVLCAFTADLRHMDICTGTRVPAAIARLYVRARRRVERAAHAGDPKAARLLSRAAGLVARAQHILARAASHPGRLADGCTTALNGVLDQALARIRAAGS